jgi:hypothetical protein
MNAKSEFLSHVGNKKVLCVYINIPINNIIIAELGCAWDKEEWSKFLELIDVDYDNGYGSQNLFGTIWYEDGTWSDRGEYDGSEWWCHNTCPKIPDELKRLDMIRDKKINSLLDGVQ